MVKFSSDTRLPRINLNVILTQTDTTVGFLSQNEKKLQEIKSRNSSKPFIKVYSNFKTLSSLHVRVPKSRKNLVRRSAKTTFIIKGKSFRVAHTPLSSQILRNSSWNYSTSANESGKKFDRIFCTSKTDIIIEDKNSLYEGKPSTLYKINEKRIRKIR